MLTGATVSTVPVTLFLGGGGVIDWEERNFPGGVRCLTIIKNTREEEKYIRRTLKPF